MQRLRKFNPVLRAIGVMGVVAGLVTAVTFAALQSNAVAIGPNTVSTGTATLEIAQGADTAACDTSGYSTTGIPGFTANNITSSTDVPAIDFCLKNTGDVALSIFGWIPENVTSAVAAGYVDLSVNCSVIGNKSAALNTWYLSGQTFTDSPLNADEVAECTADISLNNTYPGSGNETIPTFNIKFVGNETNPHPEA